jgi:tetratricopeptide (TPR) repeat protein
VTRTFALVLALALVAPTARAQPDDNTARAKVYFDAANKHYDLREFSAAIDSFKKAYELLPEPIFLFDIAQAYRQLRECENSAAFYRTYLRNAPSADNRAKVDKFIVEMDDCAKTQQSERDATAARDRELRDRAQQQPPNTTTIQRRDRRLTNIGMATAGVGVLAMVAAVYFSIDGSNNAAAVQQACKLGCEAADVAGFDRTGHDDNRNATILYVGGGLALAAGTSMVLWSLFHLKNETIVVAPTQGGATVSTGWRF